MTSSQNLHAIATQGHRAIELYLGGKCSRCVFDHCCLKLWSCLCGHCGTVCSDCMIEHLREMRN